MLPVIETDHLRLMQLNKDFAEPVLNFYEENKDVFEPWEPRHSPHFYSLSYQTASLSAEAHQMQMGKFVRYWAFLKDYPSKPIGTFCLQNMIAMPYQSCSLGYKFDRNYHHQGYAYESISYGLNFILNTYPIHRIEAYIMPENLPSLRLIQRLNFTYEGTARSYANINGLWMDHKRFSFINSRNTAYNVMG